MTRILTTTALAIFFIFTAPIVLLLITGDFPSSTAFYGLQEDDQLVVSLFNARDFLASFLK
jgi:hypothetical protein